SDNHREEDAMLGLDPATPTRRRLYGRLGAIFFLGGGALSIATLPISPPDLSKIGTLQVGLIAIAIGVVSWFTPWDRWRRSASLALVPPGFALIAAGNLLGGSDYHTYGIFFVVAFVWVGVAHPPRTSLLVAPLGAIAYALPLYYLPGSVADGLVAGVITLGVCVLVGEALSRGAEHLRSAEAALRTEAEESRRLKELDEVKTTFLHAVSHDLRAPLMTVRGAAATIQRSEPSLAYEEAVGLAG